MIKLMCAGVHRNVKSFVTWIALIWSLIDGVLYARFFNGVSWGDSARFVWSMLAFTALISLSVVTGKGTCAFRNKMICGYTKGQYFLSELLLALGLAALMVVITLSAAILPNLEMVMSMELIYSVRFIIGAFLAYISLAALVVVLSLCIDRKTAAITACLLFVVISCTMLEKVEAALLQPKYGGEMVFMDGEFRYPDGAEENPRYIGEPVRSILTVIYDMSPYGQLYRLNSAHIYCVRGKANDTDIFVQREKYLTSEPLYAIGIIAFSVLCGLTVCKRKDFE